MNMIINNKSKQCEWIKYALQNSFKHPYCRINAHMLHKLQCIISTGGNKMLDNAYVCIDMLNYNRFIASLG